MQSARPSTSLQQQRQKLTTAGQSAARRFTASRDSVDYLGDSSAPATVRRPHQPPPTSSSSSARPSSSTAQPPPWSSKRVRPVEHHSSAFRKTASEAVDDDDQPLLGDDINVATSDPSMSHSQRRHDVATRLGLRDRDSWQTLSTMTHHSEDAALAAIRRLFVAANIRRSRHLARVQRRDARQNKIEDHGHAVLREMGIDPAGQASRHPPVVDPLIRCMQGSTFLGDLVALTEYSSQELSASSHRNAKRDKIVGGGKDEEEFPTVVPEEFWVFEDTPLVSSVGLDEDIIASEERNNPHVPANQRSQHTASLSSRVFPSRGSRCSDSRVEVFYLANALDTMIQRYLTPPSKVADANGGVIDLDTGLLDKSTGAGLFPRHPTSEQLQNREEILFNICMVGIRELVRHNAARTIERGRVLERLRLAVESLWESRKATLDKAEAELRDVMAVNDPTRMYDYEKLVELQAHQIEQLQVTVADLKEQNHVLRGMDQMLKLAREKEKATTEYLTRQAARNVTLSRLQQQIGSDMTMLETELRDATMYGDAVSGRGRSPINNTIDGASTFGSPRDGRDELQPPSRSSPAQTAFAPIMESLSEANISLARKKSYRNLLANSTRPPSRDGNSSKQRGGGGGGGAAAANTATAGTGETGGGAGAGEGTTSNGFPSHFQTRATFARDDDNSRRDAKPETRDFSVGCNMDRGHDRDIMEFTRALLESSGSMLHIADKLTATFFGTDVHSGRDPIGAIGVELLKDLTRKTLQMEAALRDAGGTAATNATAPADAISMQQQLGALTPSDNTNKIVLEKETLAGVLATVSDAAREVYSRLQALSRHPGVVNAVDPLVPPTSPDQPCSLCGRTVLRKAEEGEDELARAIGEIQQLSAGLDRATQEVEMYKEEILKLESKLRRKGYAATVDASTDADPALDANRKLSPTEDRDRSEFTSRCVMRAVKAFKSLIFVEHAQQRKKHRRRRTLQIAGSAALRLHKAVAQFQGTAASKMASSFRRTNTGGVGAGAVSSSASGLARATSGLPRMDSGGALSRSGSASFKNPRFGSGLQFVESGAFGREESSVGAGSVRGGESSSRTPSPPGGAGSSGSAEVGKLASLPKRTIVNNNNSNNNKSAPTATNALVKKSLVIPPFALKLAPPAATSSKAKSSAAARAALEATIAFDPAGKKSLGWVIKHFHAALDFAAKHDQRKASIATGLADTSAAGLLAGKEHAAVFDDLLNSSISFAVPPASSVPMRNPSLNSDSGLGVDPLTAATDDSASFFRKAYTVEEALQGYFRTTLGAKSLVEENMAAFAASWQQHNKATLSPMSPSKSNAPDPRITVIEKLSDKRLYRSTRSLMLFVASHINKSLNESADMFGERFTNDDDDPRHAQSISLMLALHSFHAVCGQSPFYKIGVETVIMYSSTSHLPHVSSPSASLRRAAPGGGGGAAAAAAATGGSLKKGAGRAELPTFGFSATEEAKDLPQDASARRILRCRVVLLAMLLEKALSEAMLASSSHSGNNFGNVDEMDAKRDAMLSNKATYKNALGDFADCCGATEAEMSESFAVESNRSFADSFAGLLRGSTAQGAAQEAVAGAGNGGGMQHVRFLQ